MGLGALAKKVAVGERKWEGGLGLWRLPIRKGRAKEAGRGALGWQGDQRRAIS